MNIEMMKKSDFMLKVAITELRSLVSISKCMIEKSMVLFHRIDALLTVNLIETYKRCRIILMMKEYELSI